MGTRPLMATAPTHWRNSELASQDAGVGLSEVTGPSTVPQAPNPFLPVAPGRREAVLPTGGPHADRAPRAGGCTQRLTGARRSGEGRGPSDPAVTA